MKRKDGARTSHYMGPIKVMTVREVSAYLQVHPTTIYRLLRRNQIPAFHVGSDCRFNIEAIDRWCKQQERDARQAAEIKVSQFDVEAALRLRLGR